MCANRGVSGTSVSGSEWKNPGSYPGEMKAQYQGLSENLSLAPESLGAVEQAGPWRAVCVERTQRERTMLPSHIYLLKGPGLQPTGERLGPWPEVRGR